MFLNYSNNLSATKSSWDGISNSISSINTNYDTQISSIKNQIDTTVTNLENLKTNKTDSVDV
jgi:phage-related protein